MTLTSDSAVGAGGLWTSDNSRKVFVVYVPEYNGVISQAVDYTFSQASAPTTFVGNSALWYDTTNKVLKCTADGGAKWYICSLPIMLGRPGMIASGKTGWAGVVDMVFNGMGFCGPIVWVGKDVKGLIPDGRNSDGTLKNIEFTTDKVLLVTNTNANFDGLIAITPTGLTNGKCYIVSHASYGYGETAPGTSRWYKPSANMFYQVRDGVWYEDKQMHVANLSVRNSKITSFSPFQSFRAADAQNCINKAGDTMNGVLFGKASALINSVLTTTGLSKARYSYLKLGNGIIMQWGDGGPIANNASGTIVLPTAFTNTSYRIVTTVIGNVGWNPTVSVYDATTTTFKVHLSSTDSGSGNNAFCWLAIGS